MSRLPPFDQMKSLAENEPQALYRLLQREVDHIIGQRDGAARERLRGLQFQIDCQKKLAKNPIDSLVRIYQMMNSSVDRLAAVLEGRLADPVLRSANDRRYHAETNIVHLQPKVDK